MPQDAELVLLVTAEADIASGLALADRIVRRNDYQFQVIVVSDNATPLVEHVKSVYTQREPEPAGTLSVGAAPVDVAGLIARLKEFSVLKVLLVPGLDQWNDHRKALFREVHATVVCFEPHLGLQAEAQRFLLLGDDRGRVAADFCESWIAHAVLEPTTLEELRAASKSTTGSETGDAASASPQSHDVVIISTALSDIDAIRKLSKTAIDAAAGPVVLVRGEVGWAHRLTQAYLPSLLARYVPPMTRDTRRQLANDLTTYSKLDFEFIWLICSATFLATFGLVQDSAAVIIGAMLVAPLMTPILGAGLALSQGNRPLFVSSLKTIAIGYAAALTTSALFGCLLRVVPNEFLKQGALGVELTQEMWSRTTPTIVDFLVGFVGGSAAAFARTRNHLSAALAGAAIAAALVPPIATAGLQISLVMRPVAIPHGLESAHNLIYGPMLLFLANMLTIMIGSSLVLWACGMRNERRYSSKDRWSTRTMMLLMLLTVVVAVWIVQHP